RNNYAYKCFALGLTSYVGTSDYGWGQEGNYPEAGQYIYARNPQYEIGTEPTPYQRVGNAYDVTEEGVPSTWALMFDGVDDLLSSPWEGFTAPAFITAACRSDIRGGVEPLFGIQYS